MNTTERRWRWGRNRFLYHPSGQCMSRRRGGRNYQTQRHALLTVPSYWRKTKIDRCKQHFLYDVLNVSAGYNGNGLLKKTFIPPNPDMGSIKPTLTTWLTKKQFNRTSNGNCYVVMLIKRALTPTKGTKFWQESSSCLKKKAGNKTIILYYV